MSYPLSLPANGPLLTLTNPSPSVWIIELHNGQDNRLTDVLVDDGLKPALDTVERHWREEWRESKKSKDKARGKGALIIVGKRGQDKFFSNGLDYERSSKNPSFFPLVFNPLLARILSFPIPTIAAINGHCFAGGFMLALACDYRVMTDGSKRNAWLCMNEVHFGAPWPLSFAALMRTKVADARLHRKIALEGHRFTPPEALAAGIIDHTVNGNTEAILAKAEELASSVSSYAQEGAWGLIKRDIYRDTLESIHKDLRVVTPFIEDVARAKL